MGLENGKTSELCRLLRDMYVAVLMPVLGPVCRFVSRLVARPHKSIPSRVPMVRRFRLSVELFLRLTRITMHSEL